MGAASFVSAVHTSMEDQGESDQSDQACGHLLRTIFFPARACVPPSLPRLAGCLNAGVVLRTSGAPFPGCLDLAL